MPISAIGNRGEAGFSLVELLVVMVILGLMSAMVVLNFPRADEGPGDQAQRLAARLRLAGEESITTGRTLRVSVTSTDYSFAVLDRGTWQTVTGDRYLSTDYWDSGTAVAVTVGGENENTERVILFDPIGGATPFTITLDRAGARVRVIGDTTGHVTVETDDG